MTLNEATDVVLFDPDRTPMWIHAADRYLQLYNQDPESFILPRQYAVLEPIISSYANNLGGFLGYVRGIRDSMGDLPQAKLVQQIYRRVNTRYTQQIRRERSERALRKAEELYGPAPFILRQAWVARLEHLWAKRRLAYLDSHRPKGGRLNIDERAEILGEFWGEIDHEIATGERIPRWEQ